MTHEHLLRIAGHLPVIDTASLRVLGFGMGPHSVQLSRWVRSGKLIQLRRGFYMLPEALRRETPPHAWLANLLVSPSYLSLESALELQGLIPERVRMVQSVTSARPCNLQTPLGRLSYRHVKPELLFGYRELQLAGRAALVARPEKALLDLVHLSRGELSPERITELRLHNLDSIDLVTLLSMAERFQRPRLLRAARRLCDHIEQECAAEVLL